MRKLDTEEFIRKANAVHGNKYTYGRTVYDGYSKKVTVTCPLHGDFDQLALNHLKGKGCPVCGNIDRGKSHTSTKAEFVRKAREVHGDLYDYSQVEYTNAHAHVAIICRRHGVFMQAPTKHLAGCGCPKCSQERVGAAHHYTTEDFVEKARRVHGEAYSYSKTQYQASQVPVTITCPRHGDFEQNPDSHLQGHGCPVCANLVSDKETEIARFIADQGIAVSVHDRGVLNGKELDIYMPELSIAIEYDGLYWHSEAKGKGRDYHISKLEECNSHGIRLVNIFEDEYLLRPAIVREKLLSILGLNRGKERVGGRQCFAREIGTDTARRFLEEFHIQGFDPSTVYVGAFAKRGGRLVAVMSFLKGDRCWELTRYATDYRILCPGVAGKCFSFFVSAYSPSAVKSFADRRWTTDKDSNLYTKLGFELDRIEPPDYSYVFRGKRLHKFRFRKKSLHKKYGLPLEMTEKEMAEAINAYRIWNCGLLKYVWKAKG